jgi:hypothetical protein
VGLRCEAVVEGSASRARSREKKAKASSKKSKSLYSQKLTSRAEQENSSTSIYWQQIGSCAQFLVRQCRDAIANKYKDDTNNKQKTNQVHIKISIISIYIINNKIRKER